MNRLELLKNFTVLFFVFTNGLLWVAYDLLGAGVQNQSMHAVGRARWFLLCLLGLGQFLSAWSLGKTGLLSKNDYLARLHPIKQSGQWRFIDFIIVSLVCTYVSSLLLSLLLLLGFQSPLFSNLIVALQDMFVAEIQRSFP